MKIALKILSFASAAFLLFACDNAEAPQKAADVKTADLPAAAVENKEAVNEPVSQEAPVAKSEDPVKEKIGKICLDASSREAARESLRAMRAAIRELPESDRLAARSALARLSIEAGGGRGANRQNLRDMSQEERRAATEAMRERMEAANFEVAKKYDGKNIYDIMSAVKAMPALSEEQQRTFDNMMRAPMRRQQGQNGDQRQRRNN